MKDYITQITEYLNKEGVKTSGSVKISEDGPTLICGYPVEECALIFTKQDGGWMFQQKLVVGDGTTYDWLGISVSISSDGNTALVGAHGNSSYTGAVYVFTRSGSTWTQQQKLTASDGATYDRFGWSVSLSSGGNTALVGAYFKSSRIGAAYVFTRSGSTWTQQQKLVPGDSATSDYFGYSVSISSDGGEIKIRNIHDKEYTFTLVGDVWVEKTT